ncbi:MAG: cytochrome c maturation protein CcmE [Acidobacteriota bacterium]
MNRRVVWSVCGIAAIAAFVAFGAGAFKSNLTPYVSFAQARSTHDAVQVAGKLVQGSDRYDEGTQSLQFTLTDEHGDTLPVSYKGLKPGNFNEAIQVVAIGRVKDGRLAAEKLLVKCPSKYQGLEEKAYSAKSS